MVSESERTGVTFPWEKQAMNGDEMPEGLSYPEQILYQQLRLLYKAHRDGIVDRETATREKKEFLHQFRLNKVNYDAEQQWITIINQTQEARWAARKDPGKETCLALVEAIEGSGVK